MKSKLVFRVGAAAILLASLQGACFAQEVVGSASINRVFGASIVPVSAEPYAENEVTYSIGGATGVDASLADAVAEINASSDGTSAHIELNADIQVSQTYTLTGNKTVTIDGTANGYSLQRASSHEGALFSVQGGSLKLTNVILDGGASVTVEGDGSWTWSGVAANEALVKVENALLTLSGTTKLQNAWNTSGNGGGIYATGTNTVLTLEKATISSCEAVNGGGVYLEGGARFVANGSTSTDVRIVNNRAKNGGGIYVTGAVSTPHSLKLINIQGNSAENGGAVYATNEARIISESENHNIFSNTASKNGGAFYIEGSNTVVNLPLTSFQKNKAENGGAVYVSNSASFIAGTVQMKDNEATNDGGAIYADTKAKVTLKSGGNGYNDPETVNSGLLRNIAGRNGGGIYAADAETQITVGESSTVGIFYNEAGNMAGAMYLENGAVGMLTKVVNIRANRGGENGAPTTPWKEELSCGGVRVDETSTLKLAGTIIITENTVGTEGREVNLLIASDKIAPGAGQNVPVECYWDGGQGGLSAGTKIGVSLQVWPTDGGSNEVLYMVGKTYNGSANGITPDYAGYFTSDRNPYDSSTGKGIFETVVRSAPHPEMGKNYNQVYLKAHPIQTPTVSAQAVNKYYDGTNQTSLTNVAWSNVDPAVEKLFQNLKEGTDYTYTATFENNAQGNVIFDGTSAKEQTVQITISVKNQDVLKVFPSLRSIKLTSKAVIYPIPLAIKAEAQDKYYDATNAAQATISLIVDTSAGSQGGLTLPQTLPVEPVQGTDYTVTASFDSAQAGAGRNVNIQVKPNGTDLAKNYIWPSAQFTLTAEILKLPLEVSLQAENKVYDGSAKAVLKGTPSVSIAKQNRSGLTLPSSLPETIEFAADYTLENPMFADENGQPVSDAGVHMVTGTMKILNDSKMKNYTMALAAQGSQAEITQRTLTPVSVKVQDKLYDGTTEAAASDLVLSGLPDGQKLEEGVDYRIVSALFEDAETGINKQVRVRFELLSEQAKRNYVLEKDFLLAKADITNDLKVTDEYTEEVSSGVMTVQDMEQWIRTQYYHVPTTLVSLSIKDANGNDVQQMDRSVAAVYSVEARFANDNGQTALYQIVWNLVEKQVEEPTVPGETPSTPEETPTPPAASPIVQTGDTSATELLALALAISATAIAVLMIMGHKRNHMKQK